MFVLSSVLGVLCALGYFTDGVKLVNPNICYKGCKLDSDCALNSQCLYLDETARKGDGCGFCMCPDGYKKKGKRCIAIKGYTSTTASTMSPATKGSTTVTSPTEPTHMTSPSAAPTEAPPTTMAAPPVATTQATTAAPQPTPQPSSPPAPRPVDCSAYDCQAPGPNAPTNDDPMMVQSSIVSGNAGTPGCKRKVFIPGRPCNIKGGGPCYGEYCLSTSGGDYCICPPYRSERQCATEKPGSCSGASGQVSSSASIQLSNTRLVSKSDPDHGSVYARHFCSSLSDCIKLCQWASNSCRSVNYGRMSGAQMCELMSIGANQKNLLRSWLQSASGWIYVLVGQPN